MGLNNSLFRKRRIVIDSSSRCNLSCPGCPRTKSMQKGTNGSISDMPMEYFKALVRPENNIERLTYNLTLSDAIYSGVFIEQLEYINSLDSRPNINVSTNGSGRNKEWWKSFAKLLKMTDRIEFAIDGLEDTNHIYRVNSKWNSIVNGIKTLRENWQGEMMWRYVIFEHNYHQVLKAKKFAEELGFDKFRPVIGDTRTPTNMILRSKTWKDIQYDLS